MFGQMLREGCNPNIITYNSLITALAAGAQWERAADVFAKLQRQVGSTPRRLHECMDTRTHGLSYEPIIALVL